MTPKPEIICSRIHALIFGEQRPQQWITSFEYNPKEEYMAFASMPESLSEYYQAAKRLFGDLSIHQPADDDEPWPVLFYVSAQAPPPKTHPLCSVYSTLVRAEILSIIRDTEAWRKHTAFTLLKYSIITLREQIAGLLSKTMEMELHKQDQEPADSLEMYLSAVLEQELLCLWYDLDFRFESVLDGSGMTPEQLYISVLKQPPPDEPDVLLNRAGYRQLLGPTCRKRYAQKQVEELKDKLSHTEKRDLPEHAIAENNDSRRLLENALLRIILETGKRAEPCPQAADPDDNRKYLDNILRKMEEKSLDKQNKTALLRPISDPELMETAGKMDSGSVAAAILKRLLAERNRVIPDKNGEREITKAGGILDDFVFFHDLREEMGVSQQTLNKYVQGAGVVSHVFSNKNKCIHKDGLKKLFEFYKTNPGE